MRRLNDYRFYELGLKLQPLEMFDDNTKYKDCFFEIYTARTAISELLSTLPLPMSSHAARDLLVTINALVPEKWTDALGQDQDAPIAFRAYWLRKHKEAFENVLSAELTSLDTYILTQQGIYNTADLVAQADRAFGEAVRSVISEEARKDFREGGRCLAFELPTASGFHVMRATEAVLRQYHRLVAGLSQDAKSPEMAQCINELKKKGEDAKTLNILDAIRDLHRNPQMHPEIFLSMDEAMRLFDIAKSAINAMADRIAALSSKSLPLFNTTVGELLAAPTAPLDGSHQNADSGADEKKA